jgi:hypothetical protein
LGGPSDLLDGAVLAIEAGIRYLPITLASFVVAPLAGIALARVQARVLMSAGLALTGLGLALMSGLEIGSGWTALLAGFLISGVGVGLLNPVIADVALSVVPKERSGMAAGVNDTFRQVGIAVGIAAWGRSSSAPGAARTDELAGSAAGGAGARQLVEAASTGTLHQALAAVPPQAQAVARNAAEQGFLHGLNEVLLLGAVLAFAGSVLALWLVREREIEREPVGAALQAEPEAARA